ncbi:MAG: hypothetical protein LBF81_05845 [Prevotellaceae bacterium]|nr:hypothetical protein [Prevotellaceae bacterium]
MTLSRRDRILVEKAANTPATCVPEARYVNRHMPCLTARWDRRRCPFSTNMACLTARHPVNTAARIRGGGVH